MTASLVVDEPAPVPSQAIHNNGGAFYSEDALQVAAGQTGTAGFTVDLDNANISQPVRAFSFTAAIAPKAGSGGGGGMGDPGTAEPQRERMDRRVELPKGTRILNPFQQIQDDDPRER